MVHSSHEYLVHYQMNFQVTPHPITSGAHAEVYYMLRETNNFFTMSFKTTDEGILYATSTRIFDLHLTWDEPTTTNLHWLAGLYGDTNIAKHINRQAVQYFEYAQAKPFP